MFESIFNVVVQAVKEWNPKKRYSKEAGYRDDLCEFLRKTLKQKEEGNIFGLGTSEKNIVQKESGRYLADLAVINSEKIGIELKFNFKTKSQRNRLVGQVKEYFREYTSVIVVLCGDVDTQQLDALRYDLKEYQDPIFSLGQPQKNVKIISKSKTKKTAQKRREKEKPKKKTIKTKRRRKSKPTSKKSKRRKRKKKEESIWDLF